MSDLQIAVVLMVKNEEKRIQVSLDSVKKDIDGIILFDTGSVDNTVAVVKKYAKKNNLHLHLLEGEFEDFSTSRNKMLDFANNFSYDYLLLFDCNDELRYNHVNYEQKQQKINVHPNLKELLQSKKDFHAFMVHQKWHIGPNYDLDYYNIKIIKNNAGFKYKGSVHEYIVTPEGALNDKLDGIYIYQDRVADNDGKTYSRWEKDLVLLNKDLTENPNDGRTQYYLAQTLDGLNRKKEAFEAYKLRSMNINGFYEERYLSMMNCSRLVDNEDEKIIWYLKAFEVINRAEPLTELAKMYRIKNQFQLAFMFAQLACELEFPSHCVLNVDKKCYLHDRWHELSISSYYVNKLDIGKNACQKAIDSGYDKDLNNNNMEFYIKN